VDERQAIAALKQGRIAGLEVIVGLHQVRATRAAFLILGDRPAAEDTVATAFLRAYDYIHQFDSARPFGPWFLRIVVNLAQRTAAQRERHVSFDTPATDASATLADLLADLAADPDVLAEENCRRQAVRAALHRLPAAERAAIIQRYYLGLRDEQIAVSQACAPGTVRWRLHNARQRLREWLRPLGEEDAS
jgi:RNA polymerase sigma factor (sigma-70 family)